MECYLRGELAKKAELNFDTLRYYERVNLVPTPVRNKSGYRVYPKETLKRLKFIKMLQNGGFSVSEIQRILRAIENPAECDRNSGEIMDEKMREIDLKIQELNRVKGLLQEIKAMMKDQDCSYFLSLIQ